MCVCVFSEKSEDYELLLDKRGPRAIRREDLNLVEELGSGQFGMASHFTLSTTPGSRARTRTHLYRAHMFWLCAPVHHQKRAPVGARVLGSCRRSGARLDVPLLLW